MSRRVQRANYQSRRRRTIISSVFFENSIFGCVHFGMRPFEDETISCERIPFGDETVLRRVPYAPPCRRPHNKRGHMVMGNVWG
jgi:hypothetical protein